MGKRHRWPNGESASLQSSRRGFDSRELSLLGPLHVELSSGHGWNHPPLQHPASPPIPADLVEVSSVFVPTTNTCSSARRHLYSDRSREEEKRFAQGGGGFEPSEGGGGGPGKGLEGQDRS